MDVVRKPLAYICSPYSGDTETNTVRARQFCRKAVDAGYIPLAPHLLFPQFLDEGTERDMALEMDRELVRRCDFLLVCGNTVTAGMEKEIGLARALGMRVMHLTEE